MAESEAVVPRAPRVAMEAPMLIRRSGESGWRRATTINISRTGVLLQTEGLSLEPCTPVEISVSLPVVGNLAASRIFGRGHIVRTIPGDQDPVMAAQLDEYRVLQHEGDAA